MSKLTPPFDAESAQLVVKTAEDAWNTRDPEIILRAYSTDCHWRNRSEFFQGHEAVKSFLDRKWEKQLHYRLMKELWSYTGRRMSVRHVSEWQHAKSGQWYRTHGNEHWEFSDDGLLLKCDTSANDIQIDAIDRRIGF